MRIVMRQVRDAMVEVLDKTTLADLLRRIEELGPAESPPPGLMYYI